MLNGLSLDIAKGEFITMLGSSGCGKTTALRIIAGLETADEGSIILGGTDVTNLDPNYRDVNTVFQNYALFPHMNVEDNIGYGLKLKKQNKNQILKSVNEILDLVQLDGYNKRLPSELSGGQRQRVAIARALINNPSVLLLDEPLGALDLQLRRQMQIELKRLQQQLGITFVYITHDQEEALNMSDRICVMRDGVFEQIGTPSQIYDHPQTSYIARFVGESNIVCGVVSEILNEGKLCVTCAAGKFFAMNNGFSYKVGDKISVAVRRENVEFSEKQCEKGGISATVREKSFAGGMLRIVLSVPSSEDIIASRHGIDTDLAIGQSVSVCWHAANAVAVAEEVLDA